MRIYHCSGRIIGMFLRPWETEMSAIKVIREGNCAESDRLRSPACIETDGSHDSGDVQGPGG